MSLFDFSSPKPPKMRPPEIPEDSLKADIERLRRASRQTILTSPRGVQPKLLSGFRNPNG